MPNGGADSLSRKSTAHPRPLAPSYAPVECDSHIQSYCWMRYCTQSNRPHGRHTVANAPLHAHTTCGCVSQQTYSCCTGRVVWCSPTHGRGRRCLGLLRPTPALGWSWCLPRPPWCNSGIRVQQPILMRGNRRVSHQVPPLRHRHQAGKGAAPPGQLHPWRTPPGADRSTNPRCNPQSSDGSLNPSPDPRRARIAPDVDL